jgi:hypothetical protein
MRKAEKRELMIEWFHQNFEDPAERTPYESREGGYQWEDLMTRENNFIRNLVRSYLNRSSKKSLMQSRKAD